MEGGKTDAPQLKKANQIKASKPNPKYLPVVEVANNLPATIVTFVKVDASLLQDKDEAEVPRIEEEDKAEENKLALTVMKQDKALDMKTIDGK